MEAFVLDILAASWSMLAEMAPYLLLGFAVAGLLSVFISPEWVERHLGGSRLSQIFKASLFGVPLPLCSCGVIPVAASLRRHGAGKGATTAFLLSTPQTGVDSIAVTWALMGPFLAIYRPLAALVTGFAGGTLVQVADRDNGPAPAASAVSCSGAADNCCDTSAAGCTDPACCGPGAATRSPWVRAFEYGLVTLPRDIGRALILGILLSGVISALVEPAALERVLGGGLLPILAAMLVGVPLYVCATASVPIAVAMIHAGLSPGAALAFLISGPATNAATLTTLWRVLGRRAMVLFLVTVALGAVGSGLLVDAVIAAGLVPEGAVVTAVDAIHAHHGGAEADPGWWVGQLSAVALLLVLANALRPRRRGPEVVHEHEDGAEGETAASPTTLELKVSGMRCNGCVQSLTRALGEVTGVTRVEVRLEDGAARVEGREMSGNGLAEAVRSLGFSLDNPQVLGESSGAESMVP